MAHHKRKGPKSTRAGCLHCKPHKHQAERHRSRSRGERGWQELEDGADEGQIALDELAAARAVDAFADIDEDSVALLRRLRRQA